MFDEAESPLSRSATQTLEVERSQPNPCSVVHVLQPAAVGGLETVVRALALGHAGAGHTVRVVTVTNDDASRRFLRSFEGTRVQAESLGATGRGYLRERAAARALIARVHPDVVHTHGLRPDVVDAPAAQALGIATVSTVHGYTESSLRTRLYGYLQRQSLRSFDAVVAVSWSLGRALSSYVDATRLHVIVNGFIPAAALVERAAARARLGVRDERFLIGWIGRVSPEKGADVAVRALAHLARVAPRESLELAMIGEGPARTSVQRLARQLGVADLMVWHGTRRDAAQLMSAFDVLVLSSRLEGTPMVVLEAMHARTPVVATRVGGVPEMLSDDDARLVRSGDSLALAAALDDVRVNRAAAAVRASNAAEVLATRYGGEAWLEGYAALYRRLRLVTDERRK